MEMGIRVICLEIRSLPEEEHTGWLDGVARVPSGNMLASPPWSLWAGESHCPGGEGESALGGAGRDRAGRGGLESSLGVPLPSPRERKSLEAFNKICVAARWWWDYIHVSLGVGTTFRRDFRLSHQDPSCSERNGWRGEDARGQR